MKLIAILTEAARNCIRRFPVPAAFVTALAALLIAVIFTEDTGSLVQAVGYFLSVGFVLSLSLTLWAEEPHSRAASVRWAWVVGFLILLADSFYIYRCSIDWGIAVGLMHASAILALVLTVFFLSFTRERDDIPSWNFALRLVVSGVACGFVGMVLWGGLSILLGSLRWLFAISIDLKWHLVVGTLFGGWLSAMLFLGCIPGGSAKHNAQPLSWPFLNGVIRYLFVPLELLYLVVLLIYTVQIVVRWQLPDGMVSWLVIASFAGLMGIEFGLYPARKAEGRRFDQMVARWLPLLLTPFLLLMTVGIVRRLSDYGITIARLYLATLNGWFYVVCIGLWLSRARRLHWIPITFAALFLLTSVLPLNYSTLTRRVLLRQTEQALTQAGATLPLDASRYDALMKSLPVAEASRISAKLDYLRSTFNPKTIEPLVSEHDEPVSFSKYVLRAGRNLGDPSAENQSFTGHLPQTRLAVPDGCRHFYADVSVSTSGFDPHATQVELPVLIDRQPVDTLVVSLALLKGSDGTLQQPLSIPTKTDSTVFLANYFYLWLPTQPGSTTSTTLTLSGLLFVR